MGEENKHIIIIKTEDTSKPEQAEDIQKRLADPIAAVKGQDQLRRDIGKIAPARGPAGTQKDLEFMGQSYKALDGLTKNAYRNVEAASKIPKISKTDDQTAKDLKEAAADNKEAAKELKEAAKEIKQGTKEGQKEVKDKRVSVAPVVPTKKPLIKKTALEEYEERGKGRKGGIQYKPGITQEDADKELRDTEKKLIDEHNKKVAKRNQRKRGAQQTQQRADEPPWQGEELYPVDPQTIEKPKTKRKKQPKLPSRRTTGKEVSRIESSDALMNQIRSDFAKFKENLAATIRTRLKTEHAGGFKVVEGKKTPYTKRGGAEVLKIANMKELTSALLKLTISMDEAHALEEKGPAAMIEHASDVVAKGMIGGLGKSEKTQNVKATRQTVDYINKYGYEGANEAIKKLVKRQTGKEEGMPLEERKGISVKQFNAAMAKDATTRGVEPNVRSVFAETVAKEEINRTIGKSIKEIAIPRPVAGPQGLPAIQIPSGGHRSLAPEYEFTPGILAAGEFAGKLIGAGGKALPDEAITKRVQRTLTDKEIDERTGKVKTKVPNIKQMMMAGDVGGMAEHASDVMEVLKTDKKGRLKLIDAYRTSIGVKEGKAPTEKIPSGKKEQLVYLDKLATDAKRLSLGFDDVLIAMGKLSKSNIYERLLGSLTAEGVGGKTSPVRTTMRNIGIDEEAVGKFQKRIGEVFTQQEIVDPSKPRLPYYQSKKTKLISPRLTSADPDAFVGGQQTNAALVALNKQTEQFLALHKGKAGYPETLTSLGGGESTAVDIKDDPRDRGKIITNMMTEDISKLMPLGEWKSPARTGAPTYQALGGAQAAHGQILGPLERPLIQSERGRAVEKSGMWGKGGYGLNLQTVLADSANTFEDQIEVAGKAVNRFSEYIKPKIKDVKDVESAQVVAKGIVKDMAPAIGAQLGMKGAEKAGESKLLVQEISKILTSKTGADLGKQAVSVIERIFTTLGTKMTTHAGSKGTVTFKSGAEGELGYTKRPTFPHELMTEMLEKKRKADPKKGKQIDKMLGDLKDVGTAPFVGFMHRDLEKKVQERFKRIKIAVLKMLDIDTSLMDEGLINEVKKKAKKDLGAKSLTREIPNEVRMSLSGAVRRSNLVEPLEAVFNNIAGDVKGAVSPEGADVSQKGEVSKVLQAMGYGWGPEAGKPMGERTLPMYTESTAGGKTEQVISGRKFWMVGRNPSQEAEWSKEDIWSGRKGQKMNVAAMGAITSMFGEKSPVTQEAMSAYMPETNRALETIMSLKTLGDEPSKGIPKDAYVSTKGLKELPGVIEKYEDLRNTVLDPKFAAGGYADIPEFDEKGKETGKRPLYIPSREALTTYETEGGGLGANTLATRFSGLLTNVEKYKQIKGQKFLETDKPDVDILRRNVSKEIGTSISSFRKNIDAVFKSKDTYELGKKDTGSLIKFLNKLYTVLDKMSATEIRERAPGIDKETIKATIGGIQERVTKEGVLPQKGGGLGKAQKLLRHLKDVVIEPKVDTENIKRAQKDIGLLEEGKSFADLSEKSYLYYKKMSRFKPKIGEKGFEEETPEARDYLTKGLNRYVKELSLGEKTAGALSVSEAAVMEGAKQFGVTTDPKKQALEESKKNIERDRRRLGEELVKTTAGKESGADILQTRRIPAVRGQTYAALQNKVDDFKEAIQLINQVGEAGYLKDTGIAESVGGQLKKHEKEITKEGKAGAIILKEGEIGLHPGKIEKLRGEYGEGMTALDELRSGKDITAMTTRFPYTGIASSQFAKVRELKHLQSRDVVAVAGGEAPGVDIKELEPKIQKLRDVRQELRTKRSGLAEEKPGTAGADRVEAEREKLTLHIRKLTKAIDLLEVKFHGHAQGMDFDGDHVNAHTAKTKKAAREMENVAKTYGKGEIGKLQTLDPRAFINKMLSYKAGGLESSMAELAGVYESRSGIEGAKIFKTPDVTKEMKQTSIKDVMLGLSKEGVTQEKIDETVRKKGLEGPEATEKVARGMYYDQVRKGQYEKLYVKTGLGESTESINKMARFLEASVGFGDKPISKKEYKGWKEGSVALGATYEGGALKAKAKPGREMQTMMNVLLENVIQSGMGAKHGGKAMFEEVSKGLSRGTFFGKLKADAELPTKDQRFSGILKANEIIKNTIRDRLDALNAVDFAAEAKRHKMGKGVKGRKAITSALVKRFSFEGFSKDMSKDIQNQILDVMIKRRTSATDKKSPEYIKAKDQAVKERRKGLEAGTLDLGQYFPEMQPTYAIRSSRASVDSLSKQTKKGKTKLDRAMHKVLSVVRKSGSGITLSDTLVQSSFRQMFEMFGTAERLGQNLEKVFKKGSTLKQREKHTAALGRRLGVPKVSAKETEMLMAEARKKHVEEYPDAKEDTTQIAERKAALKARQGAIKKHVAVTRYKKDLLSRVSPEIGELYQVYAKDITARRKKVPPKPPTKPPTEPPTMPPQDERSKFMGVAREEWAMDTEKVAAGVQEKRLKEQERRKIAARKRGRLGKGELIYPQPYDIEAETFKEPYSFRKDISYALKSREIKSRALIHAQTLKQTGFKSQMPAGELWMPKSDDPSKVEQIPRIKKAIPEIPKGKTADVDYSMFGKGSVKNFVSILGKYREALRLISEDTKNLTEKQTKRAAEALQFVEAHRKDLASIPSGARGRKAATDILGLSDKIKKVKPAAVIPSGKPQYGSDLEALVAMTTKAEQATGFSAEGMPDEAMDILKGIRTKRVTAFEGSQRLRTLVDTGEIPKERQKSLWKQYHVEKVQAEVLDAQRAEKEGDYASKERAILGAKKAIVGTFPSSLTPFLTRAGETGRVTGHIDEEARTRLGIRRVGVEKKEIYGTMARESGTAAAAMKPLLFGTGRMEERLKAAWAILRRFSPELAKSGEFSKAFNFDAAVEDIAIIREGLMKLKRSGRQMSPGEFAELEHALVMTKKMEKAVVGTEEKALPSLALPGLETRETAEAAFENLQAKAIEDMMVAADVAPGTKRKVAMKIPTGRGTAEKREVTLVARGDQAYGAAGKVVGVDKVSAKTTMEKEYMPSARAVKLFEQIGKSTDVTSKKIKDMYLGVKRFSSATGEVNFDEALSDLQDLQILIKATLQQPGLDPRKAMELQHIGKAASKAYRTLAETPQEQMPGVIMKGMETQASAEAALKQQVAMKKEAMMGMEDLEVGMAATVAATIPTEKGPEKRKVRLVAVGDEEGMVTGVREEKYKPKKDFIDDLLKGKSKRISSLFKSISQGYGDTNNRIQDMVLGIKKFNLSAVRAGKHADAINFDTAESDLQEMISLFDQLLKGATTLTDKEREMFTIARAAAREMKGKIVKTPEAARKGITMGGYETPESSLAAYQARIKQATIDLRKFGEVGRSVLVTGKVMTASGQEETRKTRVTARGDRWFGYGGRVSKVSERDEMSGGMGAGSGSVIRRVAMWGSASGIIYGIIGGVKSMLETMKAAEVGMVNLRKVMPSVGTDFGKMRESAIGFAKTYGAELKGVLETMRIFAQQGLPQPEVLEMARVSTLAANVTTMDPTKAAEALTSATRQFNLEAEDSIKMLDSWNEVENKFAITAADLADGFKKAGTAAKITGIDVDRLNGIITAIGESTRQTGKEVGTSLKFIFSRMATEKAPKALTRVGVETMSGGRLREGSAILDDLAKKWVGLSRSQRLATAQAIGGIRHYNTLMVLMENYDRALAAAAASANSAGSAEKENKIVMETYEKQLAKTKASFDALAVSASGPILSALKAFTTALRGIMDVMTMIPGGGLGAMMMGAYGGATMLGKYFDLSMFGLLGERGAAGEKRKARTPFGIGRAAKEKYSGIGARALQAGAVSSMMFGVEKTEQRGLAKQLAPQKITPSVGALGKLKNVVSGIGPAFVTARNTSLGFLASLGPFAKIALVVAAVGSAVWAMGKAMSSAFAPAAERTEEYTKNLEVVEATLDKIGGARSLSSRLGITTEKVKVLEELTPRQVATQVRGRSYKSPLLLMKKQQQQVQDYANAVASMTTAGTYGFDSFGNAIISTTDELGGVVTKLEEIASKSLVDLKLHIVGEELEDLTSGAEEGFLKRFRNLIRGTGKLVGADVMEGYLTPYEKMNETLDKMSGMRAEVAKEGRIIEPPSMELKKEDPKLYKKRKEEYKEYTELNVERMSGLKEFDEKLAESKREFMSIRRPGLMPELAGRAAAGETGAQLAELEAARSPFYRKRGVEAPEIQAGYFHKLLGSLAVRPTAMLTRETAMEQGILPREATAEALENLRAGDIMLTKKEAKFKGEAGEFGIAGGQIQLFKSIGEAGEDMVAYVKKSATASGEILEPIVQSKKEFFEMLGGVQNVAGNISEVVDSAGMLSETAMKLRAISIMPTGAEAGMFKPTKEKKLDLGKQYKFQVDTGMLIQNNAFKNLSKNTEGFVNSYVQKQGELRKQQKAALDIYGKRADIDTVGASSTKALALSLAGVTNTAIQLIRATTEMDKSFARLALRFKEQQAIQDVRRQVKFKTSGLLTGMPEIKVPQIDTRKFSELSPHEKLRATSPEYEKTLLAYDKQLNEYNAAVTKAETSAKTKADIEYIKEEAAGRGISQKEIDELVAGTAITGSKETGPMLSELSNQTTLLQKIADETVIANSLMPGGIMPAGIKLAGMRAESPYETAELREKTIRAVSSDVGGYVAGNDWGAIAGYGKELEKASESYPATRKMMTDAILSAASPAQLKTMLFEAGTTEEEYAQAKEKKEVGSLLYKKYEPLMKYAEEYGKEQKEVAQIGDKGAEKTGLVFDYMDRMKEEAREVIEEQEEKVGTAHKSNIEAAKEHGEALIALAQRLAKAQIATKTFDLVIGDLGKAVENLAVSFLKLEKQSMTNKALIDTRAQYMSTRGGPMARRGPAVDIDVGTTAGQYQPHQVLYNKSQEYRGVTTGYLKDMEDVKTARSKLESISKIEAQKKFLEQQPGAKPEDIDRFLASAMRTGSVELAPVVTELSHIRENTAKTADNVLNIGKETKEGTGETQKQQKSAEVMMEEQRLQAQAENRTAEKRAKAGADYLRKEQIKVQTAKDVAAGRGRSQDQVNREESEFMATLGHVPPEVKRRNEQLRAVYEKEKKARADFELAKQKELKPLQQASGGMASLISSIQTGVAGIEGGRNIRPLQRNLEEWSKRPGRSAEEVAEAQGQFGLAQSLYSQNLSLRAQGADTGVVPRELYDIMEKASKGEDVTDELQSIEKRLAEAKEKKDEQIRKIQAKEYAMAMSNSAGTKQTNSSLDSIDKNNRSMIGAVNDSKTTVADAIKSGTAETVAALKSIEADKNQTSQQLKTAVATPDEDKSQKTLQTAKNAGMVAVHEVPSGEKAAAETKASHVYTGAYGGAITETPIGEHQWGVPVGQDSAYAFVEKMQSAAGELPTTEQKEDYLSDKSVSNMADILLSNAVAEAGIPVAEKAVTIAEAEKEPGMMSFGEKIKPFAPAISGREDYLLAGDKKKSQMAAALPTPFGKNFVETDFGYADRLKEAGKTDEEIKKEEMIKSAAKGGLTMTLPREGESVEEFAERTKSPEQKREDAARRDLALNYRKDRPVDSYGVLKEEVGPIYGKARKEDLPALGVTEGPFGAKAKREELFDKGPVAIEEKEKAAGLEKEDKKSENLKKEILNKDTKQSESSRKENKDLNNEISDLKDEVDDLKTTISDVNDIFKDLSDSIKNVTALGDASKDSASLIDGLGDSASSASSSLDTLSSKTNATANASTETGPTMVAEMEDFDFISEEDAINLVDFTKGELLEKITEIDNVETVNILAEKTEAFSSDIASLKEEVLAIPRGVNEEDFNAFKDKASEYFTEVDKIKTIEASISELTNDVNSLTNEISAAAENTDTKDYEAVSSEDFENFKAEILGYMETVEELKTLTDELTNTSSSHSTSILDLETAFGLVENKLRDHDSRFTKMEERLDTLDHKFTEWIRALEDDVATAIDLARSAYNFATV